MVRAGARGVCWAEARRSHHDASCRAVFQVIYQFGTNGEHMSAVDNATIPVGLMPPSLTVTGVDLQYPQPAYSALEAIAVFSLQILSKRAPFHVSLPVVL